MNIQEGACVLVNLAPFIGSSHRSKVRIPCRVLAVDATHFEVRTEHPFREFSLRVLITWVEGQLESDTGRPRLRTPHAPEVRGAAVGVVG